MRSFIVGRFVRERKPAVRYQAGKEKMSSILEALKEMKMSCSYTGPGRCCIDPNWTDAACVKKEISF